jgi:transposase-like protein
MKQITRTPETLVDAVRFFADPDICISFLASLRWSDGRVACPVCGSERVTFLSEYRRWKCQTKHPRQQFSIKVGTIFEDSPIGLDKWLPAVWMLVNDKNGISSYEVARALGVTQKTAWFMLHRIRLAMEDGSLERLRGRVEADETFIGGKVHNMHLTKRRRVMGSRRGGAYSKAIVMGILERESGKVRARIVESVEGSNLKRVVRANIEPGAELITDSASGYRGLGGEFMHQWVNHMREYVRGHVHTNGLENFWSLLKRAIKGTYVNVEPYHLHRYVEEQAFRYNKRFGDDADRFVAALRGIIGRRITYKALTTAVATT